MTRSGSTRWFRPWLGSTAAAAVVATAFDAALLQRSRSYFTGGFLSVDHISSWVQAVGFFAGSLASDASVIGILVVGMLWACVRLGLSARVSVVLGFVVSLAPVVVADIVEYQLHVFLGDAFDLALMFQLVGRSPAEIFAVSSSHVVSLASAFVGVALVFAACVWGWRSRTRQGVPVALPSIRQAAATSVLLLVVGAGTTTILRSSSASLDNGLRRKPSGQALASVVDVLSDVDRDGYGVLGRLRDPAPLDADVHPYALDVPGNGIDEDGVGGDLPADALRYEEPSDPGPRWQSTPPVVLVALESFRADAFGATLDGRPVTPVLDALAATGVSASRAYSHNGYTVQSRQHLFSGSLAGTRRTTLVDDFNAAGYETGYFSGQDESFGGADSDVGFARAAVSYDARQDRDKRYSTFSTAGSLAVPHDVLVARVATFLKARRVSRPLFLYVNFHDTHYPYHHATIQPLLPTPVLAQAAILPAHQDELRRMYLNTAANVDAAIGRVVALVRDSVGRQPAVIVLSDHGESLFDEGFLGHGYALNDAQTRIPLIVSGLPLRLVEPFGQADLRDAIRAALAQPTSVGRPVVDQDAGKSVFQYLGNVDRPAQIGLMGLTQRVLYDFRTERARVGDAPWRRPDQLSEAEARQLTELVQLWERMMVARSHGTRDE